MTSVRRWAAFKLATRLTGRVRQDGLALLLFVFAALLALHPILRHPRTEIIGLHGDNVLYAYMTGWVAHALALGQWPLIDPRLGYPETLYLARNDAPFLSMLLVAPATLLFGPTFGYNLILFLTYFLGGYACYRWILQITGSRAGGMVAGMAFLLSPYHVARSHGHLNLISTYGLPLFFWALDSSLNQQSRSWRALLPLATATFLVGTASQQYLVIGLLLGLAYALLALAPRTRWVLSNGWRIILAVLGGALLSALPYLAVLAQGAFQPYRIEDTRPLSASPLDFFVPPRLHALWGHVVAAHYPRANMGSWGEMSLYLGLSVLGLALVALVWPSRPYRRIRRVWLAVGLVAAVLALGTDLHLFADPVQPVAPLWLPTYYLAKLPVIGAMRAWSRFGIVTILFSSLLAGVGMARLMERAGRLGWLAVSSVLLLIVIDLLPRPVAVSRLEPRPIDRWLAAQSGDFAAAFLPVGYGVAFDRYNFEAMYGSLAHGKHLPAYAHEAHRSKANVAYVEAARDFPDSAAVAYLRRIGLRYLILNRTAYDGRHAARWEEVEQALHQNGDLSIKANVGEFVVLEFD